MDADQRNGARAATSSSRCTACTSPCATARRRARRRGPRQLPALVARSRSRPCRSREAYDDLDDDELAIACASHRGRARAARGGAQSCSPARARPSTTSRTGRRRAARRGSSATTAPASTPGMLAACRANGWPFAGYRLPIIRCSGGSRRARAAELGERDRRLRRTDVRDAADATRPARSSNACRPRIAGRRCGASRSSIGGRGGADTDADARAARLDREERRRGPPLRRRARRPRPRAQGRGRQTRARCGRRSARSSSGSASATRVGPRAARRAAAARRSAGSRSSPEGVAEQDGRAAPAASASGSPPAGTSPTSRDRRRDRVAYGVSLAVVGLHNGALRHRRHAAPAGRLADRVGARRRPPPRASGRPVARPAAASRRA